MCEDDVVTDGLSGDLHTIDGWTVNGGPSSPRAFLVFYTSSFVFIHDATDSC